MKLADLPKAMELAQEQEELAKLAQLIEEGYATVMIHLSPEAPGGRGMKSIPDAVSYGCEESMINELVKGIEEMQQINRNALKDYGVEE
jgi:hypothetical protein